MRGKPGRKAGVSSIPGEMKAISRGVSLRPSEWDALTLAAQRLRMTKSDVIRRALELFYHEEATMTVPLSAAGIFQPEEFNSAYLKRFAQKFGVYVGDALGQTLQMVSQVAATHGEQRIVWHIARGCDEPSNKPLDKVLAPDDLLQSLDMVLEWSDLPVQRDGDILFWAGE